MNIVLTINNNYVLPATVMLSSLFENNRSEKHHIYLLCAGGGHLSTEGVKAIEEVAQKYHHNFSACVLDEKEFHNYKVTHHFSVEAYFRFLVQTVLPEDADRAIYLEADQIILRDISEFYHQDLQGKCVAVCRSVNSNPGALLEKLKLPLENTYFNSGVILYDLQKLRQSVPQNAYFDYLNEHSDRVTWMDQDVLNVIYADIKYVADYKRYNYQVFSDAVISQEECRRIAEETSIIHYIGGIKPWHPAFRGKLLKYYDQYAQMALTESEWKKQKNARTLWQIQQPFKCIKKYSVKAIRCIVKR